MKLRTKSTAEIGGCAVLVAGGALLISSLPAGAATLGRDKVVSACTFLATSTSPITGAESFAGFQADETAAAAASSDWNAFAAHANDYVNQYVAVLKSDWTIDVTPMGNAQHALAEDCSSVGVTLDTD
ncbi:hypothetical protein ATY41_02610 [Leifsonia xyli subsp. xyli]|uniref:Uncharacterized protein n=1 Tax=Leifsonia xyli subsp. xyli TaxID=59736 RepID=A0A1E2SJS9_LEIXY|nr:hypothetical protein ATY41_02610 [Leifsonia xyli subsp. xyli]